MRAAWGSTWLSASDARGRFPAYGAVSVVRQAARTRSSWAGLARPQATARGYAGALPFAPEIIGSLWNRYGQADEVAINWPARAILIGECKWGTDAMDRQTLRDLIERTMPLTLADLPEKGAGWQVTSALFSRARATPAARAMLEAAGGFVVDLSTLFAGFAEA
jgi:hypothetical protein